MRLEGQYDTNLRRLANLLADDLPLLILVFLDGV